MYTSRYRIFLQGLNPTNLLVEGVTSVGHIGRGWWYILEQNSIHWYMFNSRFSGVEQLEVTSVGPPGARLVINIWNIFRVKSRVKSHKSSGGGYECGGHLGRGCPLENLSLFPTSVTEPPLATSVTEPPAAEELGRNRVIKDLHCWLPKWWIKILSERGRTWEKSRRQILETALPSPHSQKVNLRREGLCKH